MKWIPYPFHDPGSRMMAIGHGQRVYQVGTWHGKDNWQGSVWRAGRWLEDSKSFHGHGASDEARKWCEMKNKRHAPRKDLSMISIRAEQERR